MAQHLDRTIDLQPRPADTDSIDLTILHTLPDDMPIEVGDIVKPEFNSPAPHFETYYTLFDDEAPVQVPLFNSVQGRLPAGGGTGDACKPLGNMGLRPFNCMVAGYSL